MSSNVGNFVISVDTKKLAERLEKVDPGHMITYGELSEVINRDVLGGASGQLRHARWKLENEKQIHFDAVPGKGLRRVPVDEVAQSGAKHIRRVASAARRGQRRMTIADSDWKALPNPLKVAHNASNAIMGAIEHASKVKTQRTVEKHIENSGTLPSLSETLDHFKK